MPDPLVDPNDLENPNTNPNPQPTPPPQAEPWFVPGKFKTQDEYNTWEQRVTTEVQERDKRLAALEAENKRLAEVLERPKEPKYDPYTGQPINPHVPPQAEQLDKIYWQDPRGYVDKRLFQLMQQSTLPILDTMLTTAKLDRLRATRGKDLAPEEWEKVKPEVEKLMRGVTPDNKTNDMIWDMTYSYVKDNVVGARPATQPTPPAPPKVPELETPSNRGRGPSNIVLDEEVEQLKPWEEYNMTKEDWAKWASSPFAPPEPGK